MPRIVKSQEYVSFYPQDEESSGSRSNIVLCFFDSKNENPEDFIPRFVNPKDMSVSIPRMSNPQVPEVTYYCGFHSKNENPEDFVPRFVKS